MCFDKEHNFCIITQKGFLIQGYSEEECMKNRIEGWESTKRKSSAKWCHKIEVRIRGMRNQRAAIQRTVNGQHVLKWNSFLSHENENAIMIVMLITIKTKWCAGNQYIGSSTGCSSLHYNFYLCKVKIQDKYKRKEVAYIWARYLTSLQHNGRLKFNT